MVDIVPQPRYEARITGDDDGGEMVEIRHIPAVKVRSANGADLYNHPQATNGIMESVTIATMTVEQAARLLVSLADQVGWLAFTPPGKRD